MIVEDVYQLLSDKYKVFKYHLSLNETIPQTFILLTEAYSVYSNIASDVSHGKVEEVQLIITYNDQNNIGQFDDDLNSLLEKNGYYQVTGIHDYSTEINRLQATFKYRKNTFLEKKEK